MIDNKNVSTTLFYTSDLFREGFELNDNGDLRTWMQGFPLGEWLHPIYGKITMTSARVQNFVKNFNERVRGTDLDVDYEHKEFTSKAAGWIVELADRGADGLWMLVEWTPSALQALKEREYRYFSPEFVDEWTRPKDKKKFKDVLFGGAITNRPFLKDILPINLSEFGQPTQGDDVEELLATLASALDLKLSDDAAETQEAVLNAIVKLKEVPAAPVSSNEDRLKKLSETDPAIAQLLADRESDAKRLSSLEAAHRLSEIKLKLSEVTTAKVGLPPAFEETMRDALVQVPAKLSDTILKAIAELAKTGFVQLGEVGRSDPDHANADSVKKFNDAVGVVTKEQKLSYRDAVEVVAKEQPALWADYSAATLKEMVGA